ncbi:uncharacterized protein LOC134232021 [Saccostrea cucullata]|uniref:uncharacterized protein LOC134232021 n=1 Tax=Saccostrea cuccullata TaxID=36930 RepID=UPI002ED452C7
MVQRIVLSSLLWSLLCVASLTTTTEITNQKNDNRGKSTAFQGIIMYVWDAPSGVLEQSKGVYSAGYNNSGSGDQCAAIEDAKMFDMIINDIPDGKVVGLALRPRLVIKQDIINIIIY